MGVSAYDDNLRLIVSEAFVSNAAQPSPASRDAVIQSILHNDDLDAILPPSPVSRKSDLILKEQVNRAIEDVAATEATLAAGGHGNYCLVFREGQGGERTPLGVMIAVDGQPGGTPNVRRLSSLDISPLSPGTALMGTTDELNRRVQSGLRRCEIMEMAATVSREMLNASLLHQMAERNIAQGQTLHNVTIGDVVYQQAHIDYIAGREGGKEGQPIDLTATLTLRKDDGGEGIRKMVSIPDLVAMIPSGPTPAPALTPAAPALTNRPHPAL